MLDALRTFTLAGNSLARWGLAAALCALTALALPALVRAAIRRFSARAERTPGRIDDALAEVLRATGVLLYLAAVAGVALAVLDEGAATQSSVRKAQTVAMVLQVALWAQAALRFGVRAWRDKRVDERGATTVAAGFELAARVVLWGLALVTALANLGVEVSALVAGLGVGGVAAALAVQNVLGDLISGVALYLDRPFDVGDFVALDATLTGTVERVGLRTTRIRAPTGEELVLSNGDIAKARLRNMRRLTARRIDLKLGVEYDTPAATLEALPDVLKACIEQGGARFDRAHFRGFGDSALLFEAVFWIDSPELLEALDAQQRVYLAIVRAFEERRVAFAFPTQTVHLRGALAAGATRG